MIKTCPICKGNFETDNECKLFCTRKCAMKNKKRRKRDGKAEK